MPHVFLLLPHKAGLLLLTLVSEMHANAIRISSLLSGGEELYNESESCTVFVRLSRCPIVPRSVEGSAVRVMW